MSRIIRLVFWGILVGWIVWLLRIWLRPVRGRETRNVAARSNPTPIQLHRDPVCGLYVSPEISVTWEQAGQIEHFCSAKCRDLYVRSRRQSASA